METNWYLTDDMALSLTAVAKVLLASEDELHIMLCKLNIIANKNSALLQ
jgi:hypothetical protein